jgi:hypothetical protein
MVLIDTLSRNCMDNGPTAVLARCPHPLVGRPAKGCTEELEAPLVGS